MAIDNGGAAPNYATVQAAGRAPSGFGHGDSGWMVNGAAGRYDERGMSDDFTQAGNLFRLMPAGEQDRLTSNIAGAMRDVPAGIQALQLGHVEKADPAYGEAVARKLAAPKAANEPAVASAREAIPGVRGAYPAGAGPRSFGPSPTGRSGGEARRWSISQATFAWSGSK